VLSTSQEVTARLASTGQTSFKIGVLADTHMPYRMSHLPRQILDIFQDVDLILHAGDVDEVEYLADLAALAPTLAVRGNLHFFDLSDGGIDLPFDLQLTLAGRSLVVNHGGWPHFAALAGDWMMEKVLRKGLEKANPRIARRLSRMYPFADVIVFGHSHRSYYTQLGDTLLFNPGSVCRSRNPAPSVGCLYLTPDSVEAEVIPLEQ
jgi:putative phosphoesterase